LKAKEATISEPTQQQQQQQQQQTENSSINGQESDFQGFLSTIFAKLVHFFTHFIKLIVGRLLE
jgi:hypothetical protein